MPVIYLGSGETGITPSNIILSSTSTPTCTFLPGRFIVPTTAGNTFFYPTSSSIVTSTSSWSNSTGFVYYTDNWQYNSRTHLYQTLKEKKGPLIKKSVKSSIKRALKLIENFGMEEDLKIFLGGDSFEISHPESDFKFVLSKRTNMLIRATERCGHHTPYNLHLYTKSDIFIADLCVYLKDTPILDQILAVSMFVKSGNEHMLLEKANYNRLTSNKELRKSLALENPTLRDKLKADFIVI